MKLTPIVSIQQADMASERQAPLQLGSAPSVSSCAMCYGRHLCVPAAAAEALPGTRLVGRRIRVRRNTPLYRQGDLVGNRFYVVHYGSFKTYRSGQLDGQRIAGFQLSADCLALDAIGMRQHQYSAIALEDSEVCEILYSSMQPALPAFHRMLSKEIWREQQLGFLLRDASADQRLASFLLDWSERLHARGQSAINLLLRMTRQDIADHLSLTRESVSRGIVRFQRLGLLAVDGREMVVRNLEKLREVAGSPTALLAEA